MAICVRGSTLQRPMKPSFRADGGGCEVNSSRVPSTGRDVRLSPFYQFPFYRTHYHISTMYCTTPLNRTGYPNRGGAPTSFWCNRPVGCRVQSTVKPLVLVHVPILSVD
jgi:hypothetical protein